MGENLYTNIIKAWCEENQKMDTFEELEKSLNSALPIGTKQGCLTIVGGFEDYIVYRMRKEQDDKNKYINGQLNSNIESADVFDEYILKIIRDERQYKCQCKCGKIRYYTKDKFLASKHRYCHPYPIKIKDILQPNIVWGKNKQEEWIEGACGLFLAQVYKKEASYKRELAPNYNIDYAGTKFESFDILRCVDDKFERPASVINWQKNGGVTYLVYKKYECRCRLCGRKYIFDCSQFKISKPTHYGTHAYYGYWSDVKCDCHSISSFQWIVNKLLYENGIDYDVEVQFSDLFGVSGSAHLRFDFAVYNTDKTIKCLIECQGEQHYMPIADFGEDKFISQKQNDEIKRKYASEHNIKLLEISYKDKKFETVKKILTENGII